MKTILFTDIDDCLIATEKKHPPGTTLAVAALDIDGNPRSFISPKGVVDQISLKVNDAICGSSLASNRYA